MTGTPKDKTSSTGRTGSKAHQSISGSLATVKEFISSGHLTEALFLFKDIAGKHREVDLATFWSHIDSILSALPAKDKKAFETIAAPIRTTAIRENEKKQTAAVISKQTLFDATLGAVSGMAGKPDKTSEAFEKLMSLIETSEKEKLANRRSDIERLINQFLPKRRKQLLEAFSARVKDTQTEAVASDDGVEVDSSRAESDGSFSINALVAEISDELKKGPNFISEAYSLFCDTINAFDADAIRSVSVALHQNLRRFPPRYQKTLLELVEGKAGKWQPSKPPVTPKTEVPESVKAVPVQIEMPVPAISADIEEPTLEPEPEPIEISGLKLTWHAMDRISRRGIRLEDIKNAVAFGRNFFAQGAEFYMVGKKEIKAHPEEARMLSRIEGLYIVCNQGWIITAYKNREANRLKS